jgi:hypothetical protein
MYQEFRTKGLEVVAITTYYGYYEATKNLMPDQEFARMKDYMEKWELPWPMVFGDKSNFDAYGVSGIPQYVVIGRDGKVSSITVGYNEALHNQLRASVEKALNKSVATN